MRDRMNDTPWVSRVLRTALFGVVALELSGVSALCRTASAGATGGSTDPYTTPAQIRERAKIARVYLGQIKPGPSAHEQAAMARVVRLTEDWEASAGDVCTCMDKSSQVVRDFYGAKGIPALDAKRAEAQLKKRAALSTLDSARARAQGLLDDLDRAYSNQSLEEWGARQKPPVYQTEKAKWTVLKFTSKMGPGHVNRSSISLENQEVVPRVSTDNGWREEKGGGFVHEHASGDEYIDQRFPPLDIYVDQNGSYSVKWGRNFLNGDTPQKLMAAMAGLNRHAAPLLGNSADPDRKLYEQYLQGLLNFIDVHKKYASYTSKPRGDDSGPLRGARQEYSDTRDLLAGWVKSLSDRKQDLQTTGREPDPSTLKLAASLLRGTGVGREAQQGNRYQNFVLDVVSQGGIASLARGNADEAKVSLGSFRSLIQAFNRNAYGDRAFIPKAELMPYLNQQKGQWATELNNDFRRIVVDSLWQVPARVGAVLELGGKVIAALTGPENPLAAGLIGTGFALNIVAALHSVLNIYEDVEVNHKPAPNPMDILVIVMTAMSFGDKFLGPILKQFPSLAPLVQAAMAAMAIHGGLSAVQVLASDASFDEKISAVLMLLNMGIKAPPHCQAPKAAPRKPAAAGEEPCKLPIESPLKDPGLAEIRQEAERMPEEETPGSPKRDPAARPGSPPAGNPSHPAGDEQSFADLEGQAVRAAGIPEAQVGPFRAAFEKNRAFWESMRSRIKDNRLLKRVFESFGRAKNQRELDERYAKAGKCVLRYASETNSGRFLWIAGAQIDMNASSSQWRPDSSRFF